MAVKTASILFRSYLDKEDVWRAYHYDLLIARVGLAKHDLFRLINPDILLFEYWVGKYIAPYIEDMLTPDERCYFHDDAGNRCRGSWASWPLANYMSQEYQNRVRDMAAMLLEHHDGLMWDNVYWHPTWNEGGLKESVECRYMDGLPAHPVTLSYLHEVNRAIRSYPSKCVAPNITTMWWLMRHKDDDPYAAALREMAMWYFIEGWLTIRDGRIQESLFFEDISLLADVGRSLILGITNHSGIDGARTAGALAHLVSHENVYVAYKTGPNWREPEHLMHWSFNSIFRRDLGLTVLPLNRESDVYCRKFQYGEVYLNVGDNVAVLPMDRRSREQLPDNQMGPEVSEINLSGGQGCVMVYVRRQP